MQKRPKCKLQFLSSDLVEFKLCFVTHYMEMTILFSLDYISAKFEC